MSARGNQLPHAKLCPERVREIRSNKPGWPAWRWASLFRVHVRTIDAVRTYQNWKHVR
jgi:hypothetical protein